LAERDYSEEWLNQYTSLKTRHNYSVSLRRFTEYSRVEPEELIRKRAELWGDRLKLRENDNLVSGFYQWSLKQGLSSWTATSYYGAVRSFCASHGVGLGRAPKSMKAVTQYEQGEYPSQEELGEQVLDKIGK